MRSTIKITFHGGARKRVIAQTHNRDGTSLCEAAARKTTGGNYRDYR